MRATWGYSVIMPNSQQCQHPSRKGPMDGQVRAHNTMPVFDRTAGSNSEIPSREQRLCHPLPGRFNAFHQGCSREVKHCTTLPCPCQQMDSLRSQLLTCQLLDCIKFSCKQQNRRKCQSEMRASGLYFLLQGWRYLHFQFIQQNQHGFDFSVTSLAGEDTGLWMSTEYHNLQKGVQFLQQIANPISHVAHPCNQSLMLSYIGFWSPSPGFLTQGHTVCLSLYNGQTLRDLFERSIQSPLNLRGELEHMPDISLVTSQAVNLTQCLMNRTSSIAHGAIAFQSLFLQIPPDQSPTFSIHCDRWHRGPDLSTVHINHIEIGFSSLTTVLFVQCQRARRLCLLVIQPRLSTLPCVLYQTGNTSQTDVDAMDFLQADLDVPITCMCFNQQHQNKKMDRHRWFGDDGCVFQGRMQGVLSFLFPSIQGLARDLISATQLTDQPMWSCVYQQLADPLNSLVYSATMKHVSSLKNGGDFSIFTVSLRESFWQIFSQLSQWFELTLNHVLGNKC